MKRSLELGLVGAASAVTLLSSAACSSVSYSSVTKPAQTFPSQDATGRRTEAQVRDTQSGKIIGHASLRVSPTGIGELDATAPNYRFDQQPNSYTLTNIACHSDGSATYDLAVSTPDPAKAYDIAQTDVHIPSATVNELKVCDGTQIASSFDPSYFLALILRSDNLKG